MAFASLRTARACGTLLDGRAVGTWGDVGCFSFYPTKNLGAYGDGGMCVAADAGLADAVRRIGNYGYGDRQECDCEGVNSRLDEIQAAVLQIKLRWLPHDLCRRWKLAAVYRDRLSAAVALPADTIGVRNSHHLFVIRTPRRASVIARLNAAGIGYGIHYALPVHRMAAYRFLGYEGASLPVTEEAANRVLSLPFYPEMSIGDVERVCSIVNEVHAS